MSNELIRCFIAIHLPDNVRSQIEDYIVKLKQRSTAVRWTKVENIHLTLKFLGEIESLQVDAVKKALNPVSDQFSPFRLTLSGAGCFPGKKRPRIFWLGLEQGQENPLFGLHHWIEDQLVILNIEKEKRRFSPHLTIGRVRTKETVDFSNIFKFLESHSFAPAKFQVETIYFMRSYLKPSGAEYQIIESYPLK